VVKGKHEYEEKSVMKEMFGGNTKVLADWYTGNLIVPTGKRIHYVHMGYASTYDSYLVFKIKGGESLTEQSLDKAQFVAFRHKQFEAFKKTEAYKRAFAESTSGKDPMSNDDAEEFLRQYYTAEYMSLVLD
jgi:hypothetical protein